MQVLGIQFSLQTKRAIYLINEKSFSTKASRLHNHIMPFCTWQSDFCVCSNFTSIEDHVLSVFPCKAKLSWALAGD